MARLTDYSSKQRLLLQLVMWLLLGGTIGMAALVTRYRTGGGDNTDWTPPLAVDRFRLQLPANWSHYPPTDPRGGLIVKAQEKKRSKGKQARELWVYHQKLPKAVPAEVFLANYRTLNFNDNGAGVDTIDIDGYPGLIYEQTYVPVFGPVALGAPRTQIHIAVVLPDGSALAIKYLCEPVMSDYDHKLLRQFIRRIDVIEP